MLYNLKCLDYGIPLTFTRLRMDNRTAFVTVSFLTEQVNVTRNKEGQVTDGDPNRVTEVHDVWTFARNTRARDPNWTLVETASPS